MKKRTTFITMMTAVAIAACGCGGLSEAKNTETQAQTAVIASETSLQTQAAAESETESEGTDGATGVLPESAGDYFTDRDFAADYDAANSTAISLNGTSASCDSQDVEIDGTTVTIKAEGTYILSGSLDDGMIIVDAGDSDKVQLVLNGVRINSETSAAIYVRQADKVFLTLAEETENELSNGGSFTAIDENNMDAVVFAKDDVTINGSGSLIVSSPAGHGIVSKDDLKVTGGTITVTAAGKGLSGKDSVRIAGGSIDITSEKDGIQADNDEDTEKGYIYICGGAITIRAGGDGISASGSLQIDGGSFDITSGEGSENVQLSAEGEWMMGGRMPGSQTGSDDDSSSVKGIKADGDMVINDGSFILDAEDDGLHSNADIRIAGGSFTISSGDDGMHADNDLTIEEGTISVSKSYEGLEGLTIEIAGGQISIVSADDGLNAAGGNDGSGDAMFGGMGDISADSYLLISGGTLLVDAGGDGLDSNGSLEMTGGTVFVSGPTNNGNGALDYGISASISGGTIVAAGASGMAENFTSADQGTMLVTVDAQNGGEITLTDSDGNVLVSYTDEKVYNSVLISCPEISEGETYTLTAGDYTETITMDSLIYGSGSGMGGGMGGPGGMQGGQMPGGMQGGSGGMGGPGGRR